MSEIYVSCDVESDGPIPGPNSMLSLGAAAFVDYKIKETFSANLKQLIGAKMDPVTREFWSKNSDAWEACRSNLEDPERTMHRFVNWLNNLEKKFSRKVVFVGYPVGYDFMFVYWYMIKFVGYSPFSFSGIDIKTLAMALLKKPYRKCTKKSMPKSWFDKCFKHSHVAVEDAIEQGQIFCNMMRQLEKTNEKID